MYETKISKIGRRGKTMLVVLVALMFIGVASAGVLTYFGEITTTATVDKQAVELSADGINWNSYDNPIEHTIPDALPGGTYCFKQWIRDNAAIPVDATFTRTDGWDVEVTTKIYALEPKTTLVLENKDSGWGILSGDGIQATLTFDTVATTFNYDFVATGLTPSTAYTLIYYADYEDRMSNWGGDNPGAIIATFMTDTSGNIALTSNSINLAMNLPSEPDANIAFHDYSVAPDNYNHAHGAKIWLVPTSDLDGGALPLTVWNPATYLFETDLIIYLDCNIPVDDYFCKLLGTELTGALTLQSGQVIPTLICHKFDLHISKGTYGLTTIVDADESI